MEIYFFMLGIYGTVYNSADTVRNTIEDLKKKLREDFVIVVTDNYSTDGTYEILKEYDFIDVIRKKSTRGLGRQIALEHLVKNYKEVDFIFYIDFDVIFVDYFQKIIDGVKKRYKENEFYGNIASYDTYREALKKVRWRDMNIGEDFDWVIQLLRNNFVVYRLCFPTGFNQIREKREKKYAKGFKYIKREIKLYWDWIFGFYLSNFIKVKIHSITYHDIRMKSIFPEDIGLDKDYLLLIFKSSYSIPKNIIEDLKDHKGPYEVLIYRSKSRLSNYFLVYRSFEKAYIKYFIDFFGLKNYKVFSIESLNY